MKVHVVAKKQDPDGEFIRRSIPMLGVDTDATRECRLPVYAVGGPYAEPFGYYCCLDLSQAAFTILANMASSNRIPAGVLWAVTADSSGTIVASSKPEVVGQWFKMEDTFGTEISPPFTEQT